MGNDGHFGQFKTFSIKASIFGWNVLRSTMYQVFIRKIYSPLKRVIHPHGRIHSLFMKGESSFRKPIQPFTIIQFSHVIITEKWI